MSAPWAWVMRGDCLDKMYRIDDHSVDLILCDLPYGTTDCAWDSIIDLEKLWGQYARVLSKKGAVLLTSAQPFTSVLVHSNLKWFRYEWVWEKTKATGFFNAKKQPLRIHESVLVFYPGSPVYYPQMTQADPDKIDRRKTLNVSVIKDGVYSRQGRRNKTNSRKPDTGLRYPTSVQKFMGESRKIHPTQKPVALMEYLIRTYTHEGQTVLDNCMGSGTTGVACANTSRNFIGIEKDDKYYPMAVARIKEAKNKQ